MSCSVLGEVFGVIEQRKREMPENSYVAELMRSGEEKILRKLNEELLEVVLACRQGRKELVHESADLLFHLMVLLSYHGVSLSEVCAELERRRR
ncbi:MAG: phosphoribosyl-ATP diphosphatase [Euryarchaeota archaeon]|nr:phosphoribosyl-ATP diphosphatase [Euryarchaeota archaeon]